ncbi:hypothetical protein L226DRAFT_525812 [Lentinus tigrinus ALCF2SS1-7]|nr:hypothetical protein L226DRAFT_525812 [Lentinus tigrinus ALCF2SS1-7]
MELADANRKILALQDAASKRETEDAQARRRLEDSLKAHAETQAQLEESRKAHSDTSVLLDDMFHRVERMGRMIDESHATALRTQADYSVLQARMFEREAEYEKRQDELRTAQRQLDQKTRETTAEVNRLRQQRDGVRRTLQAIPARTPSATDAQMSGGTRRRPIVVLLPQTSGSSALPVVV